MNGLSNLIALNKAKKEQKSNETQQAAEPVRPADNTGTPPSQPDESPRAGSVPAASEESPSSGAPSTDGPVDAPAPNKPAGGLGLNRLGSLGKLGGGVRKADAGVNAGNGSSAPERSAPPAVDDSVGFSLDDIARLDESSAPAVELTGSGYEDEIEATAPDRALPAELNAQQLGFVESLDGMYQVLNDPEMFGQSVRMIMMELQENPEYIKLISDQDVHTMIRAMRNTMGLARIKKQSKSRTAKNTAAGKKKGALDDKMMALLDGVIGDDD